MRRVAILAIVLGFGAASAASAAAPAKKPAAARALKQAAFAPKPAIVVNSDPIGSLLDHDSFAADGGLYSTTSREAALSGSDSLRIRDTWRVAGPGELPYSRRAEIDPHAYEVTVIRKWPGAVTFDAGDLAVDVSPHAGLGVIGGDRRGGSAEAGATVQLSKSDLAGDRLKALGVSDGAKFGDQGRWYLFAAASGRAVGLNMLHGAGGWDRAGWSTDSTSKLVGDTQVGLGWRKGDVQTSVGYVHRKVKGAHVMYGIDPHDDDMVAFSLSIKPRK